MFALDCYAAVWNTVPVEKRKDVEPMTTIANAPVIVEQLSAVLNRESAQQKSNKIRNLFINTKPAPAAPEKNETFRVYTESEINAYGRLNKYAKKDFGAGRYDPICNFMLPIRDRFNHALRLTSTSARGVGGTTNKRYGCELITDYLTVFNVEARARLYDLKTAFKIFTENDVQSKGEESLIGQGMVIARKALLEGECIGFYGGQIVPLSEANFADPFCMNATWPGESQELLISGDNILSKINTVFDYDEEGFPIRQAKSGYNLENVRFTMFVEDRAGKKQRLACSTLFTLRDIAEGEELRFDYGYSEDTISHAYGK